MREDEHYQLELERMEQLEKAIERATQGEATEDDWNIIRFECGILAARTPNVSRRKRTLLVRP